MRKYQWGTVGFGTIIHEFAESSNQKTSRLTAVAFRISEKAENFARRYNIPKVHGSCQEILDGTEINIMYIAVSNRQHIGHILAALEAGEHVLCEKATATNKKGLADAMRLTGEKNLISAEAVTIFSIPLYQQLRSIMDTGKLGALKMIQAPFGSYEEPDPKNRFFNSELAGGALLDIGMYAISFVRLFLNSRPEVVTSTIVPFETGVDEQSVTILRNKENELAAVSLVFQVKMPRVGIVTFENGYMTIIGYPRADRAEILFTGGIRESIESENISKVMNYEVENMVHMIEGDLPNRSSFLAKDAIEILDQMQILWKNI